MRDEVSFALVSIYTKSARSLVKLRSGCLQINTRKLPGLNWGTDNKENNLLHAVFSFNSYNQPGYDDEMPCNIEATQSQAATATHAYHVIQACNHIKDFKSELQDVRGDIDKYCTDGYSTDWYSKKSRHRAIYAARCCSATVPKQCQSKNTEEFKEKSAYNDHISEMDTYVDPNNDAEMSSLLCVLPALLVSREGNPIQARLQYCADDLPSPHVLDVGSFRWRRKWLSANQNLPSSTIQALEECENGFFPNRHTLLRILFLCT